MAEPKVDPQSLVEFPEHGEELENEHGVEVVVHDLNEAGEVIGWHKELKDKK